MDKISRAHGGCLGTGSRRRTRQAAISPGEWQTHLDPGISEWGNPAGVMPCYPRLNQIGRREATGGTETSKYPEEEKSTENPLVAASERAPYAKPCGPLTSIPSRAGHVKPGPKPGGPPSKAEHSPVTDSEPVP